MTTQHLIFCNGKHDPSWVYTETPVTRDEAIAMIASGEPDLKSFHSVIAYDLESGRCWDATSDLVAAVCELWADSGEPLSGRAWEFVERFAGAQVARGFAVEGEFV